MTRLTLLALPLFLLFLWSCGDDAGDEDLDIRIPVSVQEVRPGSIAAFVSTSATVSAILEATLNAEASGRYRIAVNPATGEPFAPGDAVRKGQVIIHIDNPELENEIRIESRELELDISQREFEKQQSLYDKGGVTLRELKNAERAFIDARYAHENARMQLAKLKVTAPFDGVLTQLPYLTPGTPVETGRELGEVMDYSRLHATANLPASELGRVRTGQPVRVTHYTATEDTLQGRITRVTPVLDPETRSFAVDLGIDNPEGRLRPGMFARIEAIVAQRDSVLVIPKEIILSRARGKTVFIVDKGAAFDRVITTGLENRTSVEVLEGLEAGDRLVIRGFEALDDRSKVKVVQ